MSEYQYYEFQAIDNPLSDKNVQWLRKLSSRAEISSTSFVNHYEWGDFKGDPWKLMERCFDAFVYTSNWGSRTLMFRVPTDSIDVEFADQYCHDYIFSCRIKKEQAILCFTCEREPDEWSELDDGSSWMGSLLPLRNEILAGDLRCLYLAWLYGVDMGFYDKDEVEPIVPEGLSNLTASQQRLVDFLYIDDRLVEIAAEKSGRVKAQKGDISDPKKWIKSLSNKDKDELLLKAIKGETGAVNLAFLKSCREAARAKTPEKNSKSKTKRRTVGELTSKWENITRI